MKQDNNKDVKTAKTDKVAKNVKDNKKPKEVKPTASTAKSDSKPAKRLAQKDLRIKENSEEMDLEGSRTLISKVLLGIILFCLTFFFARTAIWEYHYYNEKEGSLRRVVETVEEAVEQVDETEVTEEQRSEYSVPANHPRYLTIEKLGIYNSRLLSLGINAEGELDTPRNIFDVGWYSQSSKPGDGGVIVIDGHNGGPNIEGVFKHINQLYSGDEIVIERGDGEKFVYTVVENKEVPLAEADEYMHVAFASPVPGKEALTLISCIGEWSQTQGTYLSRQFVRAVIKK